MGQCGKKKGPAGPCGERRRGSRSEEHTSELQSHVNLVCRLLLEKKKKKKKNTQKQNKNNKITDTNLKNHHHPNKKITLHTNISSTHQQSYRNSDTIETPAPDYIH